MNQKSSITATAAGTPGSADAGAAADRAAGHAPLEPDTPADPKTRGAARADEKTHSTSGPGDSMRNAAVHRTASGWRVGEEELPDLVSAMVFADLLVSELPSSARPAPDRDGSAGAAGSSGSAGSSDAQTARLKMTIAQLEHALANRVRVEQAIGILTERYRVPPRQAFDMLRTAARSRGRRVQQLAEEVVANVTNPLLPVAEELARPQQPSRARRRSRSG
jgi:ANTAR domain